jgi:hypothetical protein
MTVLDWILQHWKDITDTIAYIIAAASILVNLTPSTKDNEILATIKKLLGFLALNPPAPTEPTDQQ